MRATNSPLTRGMHHIFCRQGLSAFSARRRRTVSRERLACAVSRTISPASSSRVQRARPSGGLAHAVATSSASSLPLSLRAAPGRGSSSSARSTPPSPKRRLTRETVETPTWRLMATVSSATPASAASRIWARLSLRAADAGHGAKLAALDLAQLDPVAYVHGALLDRGRHGSGVWCASASDGPRSHGEAGSVPGLHRRLHARERSSAGRSRPAAPFRRQRAIGAPDGGHVGTGRPDPASVGGGTQHRGAGGPRMPTPSAATPNRQILCAEGLVVLLALPLLVTAHALPAWA